MKSADFMTSGTCANLAKGLAPNKDDPMTANIAQSQTVERLTYTVDEAAQLLGISRNSAYEAVRRGEIPIIRVGRRLLVPRSRLETLLDGQITNVTGS